MGATCLDTKLDTKLVSSECKASIYQACEAKASKDQASGHNMSTDQANEPNLSRDEASKRKFLYTKVMGATCLETKLVVSAT